MERLNNGRCLPSMWFIRLENSESADPDKNKKIEATAQLVELSLLIAEVHGSNPVMDQFQAQ